MRMVLKSVVVAAACAGLMSATPALAITNGQPDGDGHPYVGLMQTYDEDRIPLQVCTGSLVSPTVFLTAGHCLEEPHAVHAEVWFDKGPVQVDINYLIALFLEPGFTGSCDHTPAFTGYPCEGDAGGTPHPHPEFCFECGSGLPHAVVRDVGVVTFDAPVPASVVARYARLPAPDLAGELPNKTGADFVGYGVREQVKIPGSLSPKPPPGSRWIGAGERMYAPGELISGAFAHGDEFLRLSVNASHGSGGICFGDSGGPDLLRGTDTVLAVNSYVTNANCTGVAYAQRVDVPEVLDWIGGFME